jgi:hypothetical protein
MSPRSTGLLSCLLVRLCWRRWITRFAEGSSTKVLLYLLRDIKSGDKRNFLLGWRVEMVMMAMQRVRASSCLLCIALQEYEMAQL